MLENVVTREFRFIQAEIKNPNSLVTSIVEIVCRFDWIMIYLSIYQNNSECF